MLTEKIDPNAPLLIMDDEPQTLRSLALTLKTNGFANLTLCPDSREARHLLAAQEFEAILLDLRMPHVTGQELLATIVNDYPEIPTIIVTAANELNTAVACMKAGAFDYILKPVDPERLIAAVSRALELRALQRENCRLKQRVLSDELERPEIFAAFDTCNPKMLALFRYAEAIGASPEPTLITGETGVGKEIMARCLYALGNFRGPFVSVNVAGLDEQAFSDTLFGHCRGAFTGAMEIRAGLVKQADGGMLFLDEIGDLPLTHQIKLLRLLQEREYYPLGSDTAQKAKARIVVATNKRLDELIANPSFRKDLLFRLRRHHIHIPPLRERQEDLALLIDRMLESNAAKLGTSKLEIAPDALRLLAAYDFPGNVRELDGMLLDALSITAENGLSAEALKRQIERLGAIKLADVEGNPPVPGARVVFGDPLPTLKETQEAVIQEALRRGQGKQSVAAQMLGMTRQALNKRLLQKKQENGNGTE
jgi:DNA-binding NtrC family response regulator